jgi:hypothetical protein
MRQRLPNSINQQRTVGDWRIPKEYGACASPSRNVECSFRAGKDVNAYSLSQVAIGTPKKSGFSPGQLSLAFLLAKSVPLVTFVRTILIASPAERVFDWKAGKLWSMRITGTTPHN